MARISSPRDSLPCGLWVPGSRTEPFFPLSAGQPSRITSARPPPGLPAARFAFAPSGIIHNQSPPCAARLRDIYWRNSLVALFVAHYIYNTVVLDMGYSVSAECQEAVLTGWGADMHPCRFVRKRTRPCTDNSRKPPLPECHFSPTLIQTAGEGAAYASTVPESSQRGPSAIHSPPFSGCGSADIGIQRLVAGTASPRWRSLEQ